MRRSPRKVNPVRAGRSQSAVAHEWHRPSEPVRHLTSCFYAPESSDDPL
jgi:hypothetical protein